MSHECLLCLLFVGGVAMWTGCPAGPSQMCTNDRDCEVGQVCDDGLCKSKRTDCIGADDCDSPGACEALWGAACDDGHCVYARLACDDEPPRNECVEGNTVFRTYWGAGSCDPQLGECVYLHEDVYCPNCLATCFPRCSGVSCDETNHGCRTGVCIPDDPPTCSYVDLEDGSGCELPGGQDGVCKAGSCLECVASTDCYDDNTCTADHCETDVCVHEHLSAACVLDEGGAGVCVNGQCAVEVPVCADGSSHGACGTVPPSYCSDGTLVDLCSQCGCDASSSCQPDGSCAMAPTNVFYIDSVDGDDSYDGHAPLPETNHGPWKTLVNVNGTTFQGGDQIVFKCGRIWQGGIQLTVGSNFGEEVVLKAYGEGDKPVISGVREVSAAWTRFDGHYDGDYVSYLDQSGVYFAVGVPLAAQSFVDGKRMQIARHPNVRGSPYATSADEDGYFVIAANPSSTSVRSADDNDNLGFLHNYDRRNTQIYVRLNDWHIERNAVVSYDEGTGAVLWDEPHPWSDVWAYQVKEDWGFFFSNNLPLLDLAGEWWHDPNTDTLFVWSRDNSPPAEHTVEVSVDDYGVRVNNSAVRLRIEDLELYGFAASGIHFVGESLTVSRTNIHYAGEYGIETLNTSQVSIDSADIRYAQMTGINLIYSSMVSIVDSEIHHNGSLGTQSNPGQGLSGIGLGGFVRAEVAGNTIAYSGYAGISVTPTEDTESLEVRENNISESCMWLDDCGGIYINGQFKNSDWPSSMTVARNIISWSRSNNDGAAPSHEAPMSAGIYLDFRMGDLEITHNTIIGAWAQIGAIFLNGGDGNEISGNTVRQWGYPTLGVKEIADSETSEVFRMNENRVHHNVLYMEHGWNANLHRYWYDDWEPFPGGKFGAFYDNYYYNPYAPKIGDYWVAFMDIDRDGHFTQNPWSENTIQEGPLWYYIYEPWTGEDNITRYVNGTSEVKTHDLDEEYCDVDGNAIEDTVTVQPYSSILLIHCYCNGDGYCYDSFKETAATCPEDCD
ncbi:right-handed parallel beta-helix repeat-containing protein [Myxococcota bacterium]